MYDQYVNGAEKISHIVADKAETMKKKRLMLYIA